MFVQQNILLFTCPLWNCERPFRRNNAHCVSASEMENSRGEVALNGVAQRVSEPFWIFKVRSNVNAREGTNLRAVSVRTTLERLAGWLATQKRIACCLSGGARSFVITFVAPPLASTNQKSINLPLVQFGSDFKEPK